MVPYVVEVDRLGEARAVSEAEAGYQPTDPQIAWHLGRFITNVALAWIFVTLRVAHSAIHIGPNTVRTRARVYIASSIALFAMWVGFVIDLLAISGVGA